LLVKVLVYNLGLAVSLRVEYSRELNFNPKDAAEYVPEVQYKLGSMVRDNYLRSAIDPVNVVNIYMGYIFCSYSLEAGEGDSLLT